MKHAILVNLIVDEIAEFEVVYKPIRQEKNRVVLSLHTIRNPYEIIKVLHIFFKFYYCHYGAGTYLKTSIIPIDYNTSKQLR